MTILYFVRFLQRRQVSQVLPQGRVESVMGDVGISLVHGVILNLGLFAYTASYP